MTRELGPRQLARDAASAERKSVSGHLSRPFPPALAYYLLCVPRLNPRRGKSSRRFGAPSASSRRDSPHVDSLSLSLSLLGPSVNGRQRLRTRYRATRRAIRAMISQGAHIVPGKVHSSRSRGSRVRSVSSFLSLSVALPLVRSASCSRYTHARRGGAMRRCVTDSRASASARGHY